MIKKFFENPVGFILVTIVALVLLVAYLPHILLIVAPVFVVALLAYMFMQVMKYRSGSRGHSGAYCTNCGHIVHGRQQCNRCNCAHS